MDYLNTFCEFMACDNGWAPSIEAQTFAFRKSLANLGVRYFAFCSHVDPRCPPHGAILLHNYPAAWVRMFSEAKYHEIDPVFQRASCDPCPFFWDDVFRADQVTPAQKSLLAEAALFGVAHGFTIPLHLSWLPGTFRASCSVVPDKAGVDPRHILIVQALAHGLYACIYHAQVCEHSTQIRLTPRERQCLALAAMGKSDWDIGQILHLSECTVHTYIERTRQRLGVSTRVQAIVQALMSGQISCGGITYRGT